MFIQITWLQGLFLLQRNQLSEKINQTGLLVVTDIGKKMNSGLSFRLPKRGRLSLESDFHLHKFDESTIADIYDYKELKEKIKSALDKFEIGDLHFEFAVADKKSILELRSNNFDDSFTEDLNSLQVRIPLMPQDVIEPVGPFESLIIVIPDVRLYLLNSLKWIIFGRYFLS